jgi:hypothetical protein
VAPCKAGTGAISFAARHSARYVERFGCPVLCHEAGTDHFDASHPVHGFRFDEQLAQDVRGLELGSICAEETTVLLDIASGALCFGDGVTRGEDGALTFMPDQLLGDDPQGVHDGLMRNLRRICEEDFTRCCSLTRTRSSWVAAS